MKEHNGGVIISTIILVVGALLSLHSYTELEKFKLKTQAYSNLLVTLQEEDASIEDINKAYAPFFIYASKCAIILAADSLTYATGTVAFTESEYQELAFIMHQDLNNPLFGSNCPKNLNLNYFFTVIDGSRGEAEIN